MSLHCDIRNVDGDSMYLESVVRHEQQVKVLEGFGEDVRFRAVVSSVNSIEMSKRYYVSLALL